MSAGVGEGNNQPAGEVFDGSSLFKFSPIIQQPSPRQVNLQFNLSSATTTALSSFTFGVSDASTPTTTNTNPGKLEEPQASWSLPPQIQTQIQTQTQTQTQQPSPQPPSYSYPQGFGCGQSFLPSKNDHIASQQQPIPSGLLPELQFPHHRNNPHIQKQRPQSPPKHPYLHPYHFPQPHQQQHTHSAAYQQFGSFALQQQQHQQPRQPQHPEKYAQTQLPVLPPSLPPIASLLNQPPYTSPSQAPSLHQSASASAQQVVPYPSQPLSSYPFSTSSTSSSSQYFQQQQQLPPTPQPPQQEWQQPFESSQTPTEFPLYPNFTSQQSNTYNLTTPQPSTETTSNDIPIPLFPSLPLDNQDHDSSSPTQSSASPSQRPARANICPTCGKQLRGSKANLDRHMLIHLGMCPFPCPVCGKQFRQRAHLKVHMKVHPKDSPFFCATCNIRFRTSASLRRHEKYHMFPALSRSSL